MTFVSDISSKFLWFLDLYFGHADGREHGKLHSLKYLKSLFNLPFLCKSIKNSKGSIIASDSFISLLLGTLRQFFSIHQHTARIGAVIL